MAEVVDQGERFHQVGVQSELRGDGARDLRDLDGVRQPVAEVVGVAAGKDLRLRFQTAKGAGMDDAVAVALKVVAVRMRRLGIAASARVFHAHRIVGEHGKSLAERPRPLFSEASIAFRLWVQSPGIRRAACRRGWRAEIRRQIPASRHHLIMVRITRLATPCRRYCGYVYTFRMKAWRHCKLCGRRQPRTQDDHAARLRISPEPISASQARSEPEVMASCR